MTKEEWLNTEIVRKEVLKILKEMPCKSLSYCPYGQLVEAYPFTAKKNGEKISCCIFGHDCPVYYLAEGGEGKK